MKRVETTKLGRVGALCFSRGKQRFSVAEKSSKMIMRFSAGIPGAFRAA